MEVLIYCREIVDLAFIVVEMWGDDDIVFAMKWLTKLVGRREIKVGLIGVPTNGDKTTLEELSSMAQEFGVTFAVISGENTFTKILYSHMERLQKPIKGLEDYFKPKKDDYAQYNEWTKQRVSNHYPFSKTNEY